MFYYFSSWLLVNPWHFLSGLFWCEIWITPLFDLLFCQVQVSCFWSLHCCLVILPNCKVYIPMLPSPNWLFGYFAKLPSPLLKWASSCSRFKKNSGLSKAWIFFPGLLKLLPPKNQMTAGFFFISFPQAAYTPPQTPFSFSLLSSYFLRLDDSLKINRSPFKFQTTLYIVFWTYWEQICVNLEIAELDSIVLILPSNNPCFFFLPNL